MLRSQMSPFRSYFLHVLIAELSRYIFVLALYDSTRKVDKCSLIFT